ncbi:hypothetical protein AURDEDRAFT_149021 [Auricularia subglabra TFB-10046 SS5]|nr:hypothetical protein AURDEDRAFT_149021 [Auricularia subglabra TFB-10046 SS5]
MSVSIEIVPLAPTVDIHGSPEAGLSTAYSLSGHVLLSLSSPVNFFDPKPRPARMLLSSLEITFEGKSEFIAGPSVYAAARVISLSKQLLPDGQPIELTNDGSEDSETPATWQVVFNLAIPGWLPASTIFGQDDSSSVSYSLFARATYSYLEDESPSAAPSWGAWKLLTSCTAPFRSRNRTVRAKSVFVYVNRFASREPTSVDYTVRAQSRDDAPAPKGVPLSVLSNIEVVTTLPSHVSTEASTIPVSLRIRSMNDSSVTERIRIESFHVDLDQHEKYQTSRSRTYASTFPVPSSSEQPPHRPLLDPHPLESLYSLGLVSAGENDGQTASSTRSIVPEDQPRLFRLHESATDDEHDDEDEADDGPEEPSSSGLILQNDGWHKITVKMPVVPAPPASTSALTYFDDDDFLSPGSTYYAADRQPWRAEKASRELKSYKPRRILRPTYDSPFYKVRHDARISITCMYRESPDAPPVRSEMKFSLPLKFVCTSNNVQRSASPTPSVASTDADDASRAGSPTPLLPTPTASPYPRTLPLGTTALPAYSQLFHSNGDSRDEIYADLPAYSKDPEDAPCDTLGIAP